MIVQTLWANRALHIFGPTKDETLSIKDVSFSLNKLALILLFLKQITDPITSKSKLNKRTKRLVDRYDTDMKKREKIYQVNQYNSKLQVAQTGN